jgi:hypothetical protein
MRRQSLLLVLRGLGLVLLFTLFLLRVATPRTHVIPGDRVRPASPMKLDREGRRLPSASHSS